MIPVDEVARPLSTVPVDILLSVYNGIPFLDEQIESLQGQTHSSWRLWVRDDGSTDGTERALLRHAAGDDRIQLMPKGSNLGALGAFGWLLQNAAPSAEYIMFCDQDDVWFPGKIEQTLTAMRAAEGAGTGSTTLPVLVHTDLTVVDAGLNEISGSFWSFEGIRPELATLNRLLVHNSVTGCTVMINSALRDLATPIPPEAFMHDWWLALAASCMGRIVSLPVQTILYRQHCSNDTGAHAYPRGLLPTLRRGVAVSLRTDEVRRSLLRSTIQAGAFLERFRDRLTPDQRRLLARYAEIPSCGSLSRKLRLLELKTLSHGWDRSLGLILRA